MAGLYENIHKKRKRIKRQKAEGRTPERMRKVGSKGAPTAKAFRQSAKTATFEWGNTMPMVKGKKYPYTKEGRAAAAKAAKKPKKKEKAKGAMYE
jgi:hypothetical protein